MEETITNRLDDLELARGNRVDGADRHLFTFGNVDYQVDLSSESLREFERALEPFLAVSTRLTPLPRRSKSAAPLERHMGRLIREWAAENGYELFGRGRIPGNVREAYRNRPDASETE